MHTCISGHIRKMNAGVLTAQLRNVAFPILVTLAIHATLPSFLSLLAPGNHSSRVCDDNFFAFV